MAQLRQINKTLKKGAFKSSTEFLNAFLDKEDEIINLLKNHNGSKSQLWLKDFNVELNNTVKFSSIVSDLTTLTTAASEKKDYHLTWHEPGSKYYRDRQLTYPQELSNEIGNDPSRMLPSYLCRNDSETKKLFQQFSPLVKTDRLLIRPLRTLIVTDAEKKHSNIYYVDSNTENSHWYINKLQATDNIIIDNGYIPTSNVKDLFEVTVPYFNGIDVDQLTKILEEENDILSAFRRNIVKVIKEAGDNLEMIEELKNDTILSSIEKMERKFKTIQSTNKFKTGSTLGSFILTLSVGNLTTPQIITSLAASLIAMGYFNLDYQSKLSDLKDDPYYLLWRMKQSSI